MENKTDNILKRSLLITGIIAIIIIGIYVSMQIAKANDEKEKAAQQEIIDADNKAKEAQEQDMREAEENRKAGIRDNISSWVKLSRSDYRYSEFGGISDLSITVTNTTEFLLDEVTVKVSYIKANGELWKDEYLTFSMVEPNSSKKQRAPESERGTNVEYELVSVKSTGLNL